MKAKHYVRLASGLLAGGAAIAGAAYATYAGITWYRYGRTKHQVSGEESDSLLDLYMPEYEVAERHHMRVAAPAETTFAATCEMKMSQPGIARALFKTRELVLNFAAAIANREFATCSASNQQEQTTTEFKEFVSAMKAVGWGVLAEIPGREIVLGAVTQPWVAKPTFRAVRPEEFAAFQEPGYVKIVFTLRADSINASESIARTETRAATTDPVARAKFRRYWALVSPGVILIRHSLLRSVKTEAERRARELKPEYHTAEFGQYAG
jgi:hypothetical protein